MSHRTCDKNRMLLKIDAILREQIRHLLAVGGTCLMDDCSPINNIKIGLYFLLLIAVKNKSDFVIH